MPDSFDYTTGTNSENVRLLQALIDDAPEYTEETNSRNANILKSIINNTEYTDAPQSEIEELLLRLKAKIGGEIEVDELTVTENGTYDAGVNKAYNPVKVELPLSSKTITENGTYTASDDNLAGFNEVTVAVEGFAKKSISNTPTDIATFNASALPMPSLTVGIEATQDLHGYDYPWPGGAGKNKLPLTLDNIKSGSSSQSGTWNNNVFTNERGTFTVNLDNDGNAISISANTSAESSIYFDFSLPSGSYILSSGGNETVYEKDTFLTVNNTSIARGNSTSPGSNFTLAETTTVRWVLRCRGQFTVYPMIRLSTVSDDTYAPYSNECPISGWSACNVVRCGKNLFDKTTIGNGNINDADGAVQNPTAVYKHTDYIKVVGGESYYIKTSQTSGSWGAWYDKNKNYISGIKQYADSVITAPSNAVYMRLTILNESYVDSFGVNYPSTDTDYHAYNGNTTTIPFTDAQGNPIEVYGGSVDVVNGTSENKKIYDIVVFDGSEDEDITLYNANNGGFWLGTIDSMKDYLLVSQNPPFVSDYLKTVSQSSSWTSGVISEDRNSKRILACLSNFGTSVAECRQYLSQHPLTIRYELATPTTFYTQPTSIKSLLGTNNLWADSGQVLSGEYMEAL